MCRQVGERPIKHPHVLEWTGKGSVTASEYPILGRRSFSREQPLLVNFSCRVLRRNWVRNRFTLIAGFHILKLLPHLYHHRDLLGNRPSGSDIRTMQGPRALEGRHGPSPRPTLCGLQSWFCGGLGARLGQKARSGTALNSEQVKPRNVHDGILRLSEST